MDPAIFASPRCRIVAMRSTLRRVRSISARFAAAALCVLAAPALHAKDAARQGLRFDSAGVLDLAERTQQVANGRPVPVVVLEAAAAKAVFAAKIQDEDQVALRFSDDEYACRPPSPACTTTQEARLIDAGGGAVRREGKRLTIASPATAAALFFDWNMAATKSADGDSATHAYLGILPGSGYHRVEVQFGHDAPGNFLVNPGNARVAFVHNGSDVAVPAPDGLHLVTFNTMNPPLTLRVAALDATGPRLALTCAVKPDSPATAQFRGWRDAHGFDLTLLPAGSGGEEVVAMRLALDAHGWKVATAHPERMATTGFACVQSSR